MLSARMTNTGYFRELKRLPLSIDFSRSVPIEPLARMLSSLSAGPLLSVGSGGSHTAATLAALLHESTTHQIGKATTPYQSVSIRSLVDSGVILFSAGGRNSDALTALRGLAKKVTGKVAVVTGSPTSKLAILAANTPGVELFSFELPFSRDGFLATNTLVATSMLLSRGYQKLSSQGEEEFPPLGESPNWLREVDTTSNLREILAKDSLIILAGGWAWPAAVDLESKFSEGSIAPVQLVDYRNFAHGRHFWLAKRRDTTGVLALADPETEGLASYILSTIPRDVKSFILKTELSQSIGAIDLICQVMFLTGLAGDRLGSRLSKPGVPEFGRRLYSSGFQEPSLPSLAHIWITRKQMAMGLGSRPTLNETQAALKRFLTAIESTNFEGLVADYDGTLTDTGQPDTLPSERVQRELIRLLQAGLILGIATGRGKSVERALKEFIPRQLWHQVVVGYHGGASVFGLTEHDRKPTVEDNILVEAEQQLCSALKHFGLQFDLTPQLLSIRPSQITDLQALRSLILENLAGRVDESRVVHSGHSVDILGRLASKLHVVESVTERTSSKDSAAVLRIGDQGGWGGNDHELLSSGHALSVDRISGKLSTCWNLSRPGHRSTMAASEYLRALKKKGRAFRFEVCSDNEL